MAEPVLAVEELSVELSRDGVASLVLDRLSFEIAAGEIVALVGESGAGKSTLALALQGLLSAESEPRITGSIRLAGTELVGAPATTLRAMRRGLVRAVPQDPLGALDPTMTIGRQMAESTTEYGLNFNWLQRTGVGDAARIEQSYAHRLSGGQRQRVLIAMAMMARPKLLIADEPTTALDVTTQSEILDLVHDLAGEQHTATLFVTHDLSVAATLAHRVIVLYAGRIVEIGTVRSILRTPQHPYTAGLLAAHYDLHSDRSRMLPTLPVPRERPAHNPTACTYAPRCGLAQPACTAARPALKATTFPRGKVACLFPELTASLTTAAPLTPWPPAGPKGGVALELAGVTKSFVVRARTLFRGQWDLPVLRGVDLTIHRGECVALVGESGAGKSTILRIAAGLMRPDGGSVTRASKGTPQVVFQDAEAALTPWLTIGEQISEPLRPLGLSRSEQWQRLQHALGLVGLEPAMHAALPAQLSRGQCQRAVVARAMIVPPALLLCDEPVSAVDVSMAATMLNLLGDLRRRFDMAMLFVTHNLAAARLVADRIAVLHNGELVEDGDPDELIAAPQATYTQSLIAAVPSLHTGVGA